MTRNVTADTIQNEQLARYNQAVEFVEGKRNLTDRQRRWFTFFLITVIAAPFAIAYYFYCRQNSLENRVKAYEELENLQQNGAESVKSAVRGFFNANGVLLDPIKQKFKEKKLRESLIERLGRGLDDKRGKELEKAIRDIQENVIDSERLIDHLIKCIDADIDNKNPVLFYLTSEVETILLGVASSIKQLRKNGEGKITVEIETEQKICGTQGDKIKFKFHASTVKVKLANNTIQFPVFYKQRIAEENSEFCGDLGVTRGSQKELMLKEAVLYTQRFYESAVRYQHIPVTVTTRKDGRAEVRKTTIHAEKGGGGFLFFLKTGNPEGNPEITSPFFHLEQDRVLRTILNRNLFRKETPIQSMAFEIKEDRAIVLTINGNPITIPAE